MKLFVAVAPVMSPVEVTVYVKVVPASAIGIVPMLIYFGFDGFCEIQGCSEPPESASANVTSSMQ